MIRRVLLAVSLSLAGASISLPASAEAVPFDNAWKKQGFSLFSSNRYSYGGTVMGVSSDGSVSLTYRSLPQSAWDARSARWSWAVAQGVRPTDLTRKGGDDRNLALYFVFLPETQVSQASRSITRLLRNDEVRVLAYVWGGNHARGSVLPSPYMGSRGKTIVLRGAGEGRAEERVDLAADFARAFGGTPGALVGVAVSADSDDTDGMIRAELRGLRVE
ncbi:DUF3047 domain-containing protein [Cognatishimia sp. F0-27]|uniref:DUF3047 domain-containing protein n=1 Tax=Cognatishimia sp. F0-27 TaxID=2816855 RepID=UPI001DFCA74D|nr:DUF3047 domain-containing protein [Cognatishimia sp. F0-27]MCC1494444.1 DUF3047 domain-containing protein [Cognatishimia sp. F0-27]